MLATKERLVKSLLAIEFQSNFIVIILVKHHVTQIVWFVEERLRLLLGLMLLVCNRCSPRFFEFWEWLPKNHHYVFDVVMLNTWIRGLSVETKGEIRLWFLRREIKTVSAKSSKVQLRHFIFNYSINRIIRNYNHISLKGKHRRVILDSSLLNYFSLTEKKR